jgi:D-alanine-D-alanine ligase
MLIGLTYDLRSEYLAAGYGEEETAEFDQEDTVAAIEAALAEAGHRTERIGRLHRLVAQLAGGARWDLVFNIAEGLHGIGREAQVPALLDAYEIAYTFSDPLVMSLTLDKAMTKRVIRDAGIPTSDFAVVHTASAARPAFAPPYFVKPVAEGTGKGINARSIVERPEDLAEACAELIARFRQPALVERFLPGREFTVGIVGTGERAEVLGTIEVHLLETAEARIYSYGNKKEYETRVAYQLVKPGDDPAVAEAEAISLAAWQTLGCRDAGRIDMRCDEAGRAQFLEVNPLAGLHPVHSDLPIICRHVGVAYNDLIARIVASASERRPRQD